MSTANPATVSDSAPARNPTSDAGGDLAHAVAGLHALVAHSTIPASTTNSP